MIPLLILSGKLVAALLALGPAGPATPTPAPAPAPLSASAAPRAQVARPVFLGRMVVTARALPPAAMPPYAVPAYRAAR
ncbi:hypothetical protein [Novosphingobium album (ex Liu et al. 2023)]|uniref:Uncharacterized protein n=1 Tax=Novosphingobium album (ex Liu et al. 2023) TaxID=3031130 RepID=A0ABT5WR81_9SPHN|nr:hypothetical protein [Novosphingobium album (ex Liu et al. 2023)]MDE8651493.1 hypothetical protein [Novosphingobium album (ex Liu et al. 2023)]